MRRIITGLNISIDGFTEGPLAEMDWLNLDHPDAWTERNAELLRDLPSYDTVLLGRVTYQIFEKYWPEVLNNPSSLDFDREFARFVEGAQKLVLSNTLTSVSWKNSRIVRGNIVEEISRLKQQPGKNIMVPGGSGALSTLADLDLIDEYNFLVNPAILGKGKSVFRNLATWRKLKLVGSRIVDLQAVELKNERA